MKKSKGFRDLIKDGDLADFSEPLTTEALYKYLINIYKDRPKSKWTGVQHYEGFFEDGTPYEYWVINGIMTGRGGYELFLKSLKDRGNNNCSNSNNLYTR